MKKIKIEKNLSKRSKLPNSLSSLFLLTNINDESKISVFLNNMYEDIQSNSIISISFFKNNIKFIKEDYHNLEVKESIGTIVTKWFNLLRVPENFRKDYFYQIVFNLIEYSNPINFYYFCYSNGADKLLSLVRNGYSLRKLSTINTYLIEKPKINEGRNLDELYIFDEISMKINEYLTESLKLIEDRLNAILINYLIITKKNVKDKSIYKTYKSENNKEYIQTTIASNILNNKKIEDDIAPDYFIDKITLGQKISFIEELNIEEKEKAIIFSLQFINIKKLLNKDKLVENITESEFSRINKISTKILRNLNDVRNLIHHHNFIFHKDNLYTYKTFLNNLVSYCNPWVIESSVELNSLMVMKIMDYSKSIKSQKFYDFILNNLSFKSNK